MDNFKLNIPLVSIVTPSFNHARFLETTICSVLEQDYPNIEYILIDGGSTDGSVDIIKKYAKSLTYWISEPDCGQTDAINKGLSRANGEILAWLNSDDTYQAGVIAEVVNFFNSHLDFGLVYGDANFIDENGRVISRFRATQTNYIRLRRGYVHIPQQSAFFRAVLWRQVGPLDPSFYFAMDYDLWVRIARLSSIKYMPRLWANFRLHTKGKTITADDRCWPEMMRVHFRDGGSWFSIIAVKYFLRKVIAPLINARRMFMLRTE